MIGLHAAACAGKVEEMKVLLRQFHAQIATHRQQTMALASVCSLQSEQQLQVPSQTEYVNKFNAHGMTALQGAVFHGQLEACRWLLEHGAAVNRQSAANIWTTALHLAAFKGHLRIARLLLEYGADATFLDGHGFTPFAVARNAGHKQVAQLLRDQQVRQAHTPIRMELNYDSRREGGGSLEAACLIRQVSYHLGTGGGLVAMVEDHYSEGRPHQEHHQCWDAWSHYSYPMVNRPPLGEEHDYDLVEIPEGPWDEQDEEAVEVTDLDDHNQADGVSHSATTSRLRRLGRRLSRRLTSSTSLIVGDAEVSQAALVE